MKKQDKLIQINPIQYQYKNYLIDTAYDNNQNEYFVIWTPDLADMVGEDFKTIEKAKTWIDQNT